MSGHHSTHVPARLCAPRTNRAISYGDNPRTTSLPTGADTAGRIFSAETPRKYRRGIAASSLAQWQKYAVASDDRYGSVLPVRQQVVFESGKALHEPRRDSDPDETPGVMPRVVGRWTGYAHCVAGKTPVSSLMCGVSL